jgi:hypothetical protein
MRITAVPSIGNVVGGVTTGGAPQQTAVQALRSQQMNTNATPLQPDPSELAQDMSLENREVTEGDEVTTPMSPQFAALAKQRRALQVKEREIADREKALEGLASTQEGKFDYSSLKSDPLGILEKAGVTYDMLTEALLSSSDGNTAHMKALEAKIAALEKGVDQKLLDRDSQAEKQVLAEMEREATKLASEGEDFELIRETDSIDMVMDEIKTTYDETGEVLTVRDAMDRIEGKLLEKSLQLASLQKIQGKLAPQAPGNTPQQRQNLMRTLTNRDTAQVPLTPKQRALQAFTGQLKR